VRQIDVSFRRTWLGRARVLPPTTAGTTNSWYSSTARPRRLERGGIHDLAGAADSEKPGAAEDPETARTRSALLADLLDRHRREDKPAWWRYFYLRSPAA
jgi:hypothetical protein